MIPFKKATLAILLLMIILIPAAVALQKTFAVQEADLVNVKPIAIDPDRETVFYTYGKPLNSSGQWQTTYDDAGEYGIEITASDGLTRTTERIILTVAEKNRPPQIEPVSLLIKEGETITLNLPEKDLDGQRLSYNFEQPFNQNGEWIASYNDAGEYSLVMAVTDGEAEAEFLVNVSVTDVNRPLFINTPLELTVNEGEELIWEIDAFDPDGDYIELKFEGLPEAAVVEQDTVKWTPSFDEIKRKNYFWNELLNLLEIKNFPVKDKTYPVAVTACSSGSCEEKTTLIIVKNVNQKPVLEDIPEITIKVKDKLALKASAIDPDGDKISYSFSRPLNQKGIWKPGRKDEGEYLLNITVSDGLDQAVLPVKVRVLPDNQPPRLKPQFKSITIEEGKPVELNFRINDPDHDEVAVSLEQLPPGAAFENLQFRWTPSFDEVASKNNPESGLVSAIATINGALSSEETKELLFKASDGELETATTIEVKIKNVNRKPEIIDFLPGREITAIAGEPVVFNLAAKDPDQDKLNYEWSFSLHEPRIMGTSAVQRTFVAPGKKKVRVLVTDGLDPVEIAWEVTVLPAEEKLLEPGEEPKFNVYIIES